MIRVRIARHMHTSLQILDAKAGTSYDYNYICFKMAFRDRKHSRRSRIGQVLDHAANLLTGTLKMADSVLFAL